MRAAVLALLAEGPRHGYAVMTELAERSGGTWRPSPGSVYPVLQQLQDEGLVQGAETEGRRVFSLTAAGEELVRDNPEEFREPWSTGEAGPSEGVTSLLEGIGALGLATREVAHLGTEAQVEQARNVLDEARRSMYRILAGDDPHPGGR
ncbi:PadR family transcriptional regulator [Kineococcus sp. NUM-3379]